LSGYAPCGRYLVVLNQHSDQVLNAILSMADRRGLLLAPKAEDLRRKVFELAAIMGSLIRMPNTRRGLGADVGRLRCARRGVGATGWLAAGRGSG
jgi:hypothetical protein